MDDMDEVTLDEGLLLDPEIQADLLKQAAEEINSSFQPVNFSYTNSVRCGSHTFQFSVNCVSDEPEYAEAIKNAQDQLEATHVPVPRLDNKTRWFYIHTYYGK